MTMHCVFVAGSRALSKLNAQVKQRLDNIVKQNFTVLFSDANGADKAVQRYLAERGYPQVIALGRDFDSGSYAIQVLDGDSA